MRQISEAVIKYYPDHVESLSNIALTYLITGEYDKALLYLLKAEQVAPKDIVVLNNIAEAYKRKSDKGNAKAYYEKVIKYGSKEDAQDARQKLSACRTSVLCVIVVSAGCYKCLTECHANGRY